MAVARKRADVSSRRSEIVSLAMDLFARRGVQAVSIREIADAAGILSGSLYTHFSSKLQILDLGLRPYVEAVRREVEDVIAEEDDPVHLLDVLLHRTFQLMMKWHSAAAVMHGDWEYLSEQDEFAYVRDFNAQVRNLWIRAVRTAVDSGALAPDVDPAVVVRMVWQNMGAEVSAHHHSQRHPPALLAEYLHRMLFGGLSRPRVDISVGGESPGRRG